MKPTLKHRSGLLTGTPGGPDWARRAAARAMLRGVGFRDEDFSRPIVTVACPYTNATPCNDHLRKLGDLLEREVEAANVPLRTMHVSLRDGEPEA